MKAFAACITLLIIAGCASSSAPSEVRNAPDYILLSAPNQVRTYDFSSAVEPHGFHVRGVMTSAGFRPAGEVQGNGQLCTAGHDWFSLADLSVHTASDGKTPKAPYILGCATKAGFQPASREIVGASYASQGSSKSK